MNPPLSYTKHGDEASLIVHFTEMNPPLLYIKHGDEPSVNTLNTEMNPPLSYTAHGYETSIAAHAKNLFPCPITGPINCFQEDPEPLISGY
jgi:hypothetical protein